MDILNYYHDRVCVSDWSRECIYELITRQFTWPECMQDVDTYIEGCLPCQEAKVNCHAKSIKLSPMPTGSQPWQKIAMDFVRELWQSEEYNTIVVATDRFTKA